MVTGDQVSDFIVSSENIILCLRHYRMAAPSFSLIVIIISFFCSTQIVP
jgi:hypothetical protein